MGGTIESLYLSGEGRVGMQVMQLQDRKEQQNRNGQDVIPR
jgi:hypothetical protein